MCASVWWHKLLKPGLTGLRNIQTCLNSCYSKNLHQGSRWKPVRPGNIWQVHTPCQNALRCQCVQFKEWIPNCNGDMKILKMLGIAGHLPNRKGEQSVREKPMPAADGKLEKPVKAKVTSWMPDMGLRAVFTLLALQFTLVPLGSNFLCYISIHLLWNEHICLVPFNCVHS